MIGYKTRIRKKTEAVILFVGWFNVAVFLESKYENADEVLLDVHTIINFDDEIVQADRLIRVPIWFFVQKCCFVKRIRRWMNLL